MKVLSSGSNNPCPSWLFQVSDFGFLISEVEIVVYILEKYFGNSSEGTVASFFVFVLVFVLLFQFVIDQFFVNNNLKLR